MASLRLEQWRRLALRYGHGLNVLGQPWVAGFQHFTDDLERQTQLAKVLSSS
jgi:hypothetical protein